ncbi:MAG: hypothetical protein VYA85_01140 [Verrucomicrobiota bacterium]|nr:hypothetical protein [Verrucomicrobiota bacterium]
MSAIKNISIPQNTIRVLRNKLARTRLSILAVELARRIAITFSVLVTLLTSLLFLDLLADLDIQTRSLLLFSIITLTAILTIWSLFSLITKWKNDETLALEIERKNKDFDSRLISSIQFAKRQAAFPENAPMSMIHNMILETKDASKKFNFLKIVNPKALTRATLIFFVIIITSGIWVYSEKDNIPILVKRALGEQIEIPRDTTIIEEPNISKVGIGDNIQMTFKVKSKKTSELKANLNIEYNSGRNVKVSLERTEKEPDTYTGTIEDVPESFSFDAQIDDAKTKTLTVTAIERPTIKNISATQVYPEFTKQSPTNHVPGDFTFFPGSEVTINIESSKELDYGNLKFLGLDNQMPLSVNEANKKEGVAKIKIPSQSLSGFSVSLTDSDEMDSKNNAIYKISLLTDLPPEIRITYPKRSEELVTRKATLLIKYEAIDRFGVNSINLKYKREENEIVSIPLMKEESSKKQISDSYEWNLGSLKTGLSEGDEIEYWLEASDQNISGLNISSSEKLSLKVVTPEEKRADLLGRTSDALGSVDEATNDQENLNKDLESIIRKNTPIKKN